MARCNLQDNWIVDSKVPLNYQINIKHFQLKDASQFSVNQVAIIFLMLVSSLIKDAVKYT